MPQGFTGKSLIVPLVITGLGVVTVASAQTVSSPFSKKTKKQAWETEYTAPATQPAPTIIRPAAPGTYQAPVRVQTPRVQTSGAPSTNSFQESARRQLETRSAPAATNYNYQPKSTSPYAVTGSYGGDELAGGTPSTAPAASAYYPSPQRAGQYEYQQAPAAGSYYPGRQSAGQPAGGQYGYEQAPTAQTYRQPSSAQPGASPYSGPYAGPHSPAQRRTWLDKLGLGAIKFATHGFLKVGGAYVDRSGAEDIAGIDDEDFEFVGHGRFEVEASAITDGGMEYGAHLELRGDYDETRRGFGGRVGDCPPGVAGCNSALVDGVATGLRGHTSQFYSSGESNATDTQVALESAHIFLRTAYGDVTAGRDDGAAYLFSLGAPNLMLVSASNSTVDFTGLDSVKTVNDASGFAEKVTYTSPRLLGDQIGIGVQLGASYAFDARACGVDYCVRRNDDDESGTLAPDLEDVIEVGLSLDRRFANGLKAEATATYATAQNEIELAGFDDLEAWNAGLELSLGDWTAGGSYLSSNNALSDGDYEAYDFGITWKPSAYGFSANYGHATDKNVDLKSDQFVFGVIREFDKFTLGTGVQYIERTTPFAAGNVISDRKEKATGVFIEGGFKF